MQLFVLRHGQAEIQKTTDDARNLTLTGRRDVATMIERSLSDLKTVQQVWISPLVRAQQTAEIACDKLTESNVNFTVKITDLIVPDANPLLLFDALQKAQIDSILLVSHQPLVGYFIDLLCGSHQGFHDMNTSSLACIDCEIVAPDMGKLRWLRHVNA